MAFHDVRLPDSIERGSQGGPEFQTSLIPMSSGYEQRNGDWPVGRNLWDVAYGVDSTETFDAVRQFFYARRGKLYGFRFRDWSNYTLVQELIATGLAVDGINKDFQITLTYEATGPLPYIRRITRPDAATLTVSVNGVPTSAFTVQPLGIIRFTVAPVANADIRVTYCEFDIPMRFDTDRFTLSLEQPTVGAIGSLPILELRE